MINTLLPRIEIESAPQPTAAVIWLHGLGADGNDFAALVPELDLRACPPIRFVFPHAPSMPVTLNGGYVMPAWYDIRGTDLVSRQDVAGIQKSALAIAALIEHEAARGIPYQRIVLAGFSQGSAMALHTGLRFKQRLAGIMALSGYLPLPPSAARPMPARPSSWRTAARTRWWHRLGAKPRAICCSAWVTRCNGTATRCRTVCIRAKWPTSRFSWPTCWAEDGLKVSCVVFACR
jgi:predicted esterase